MSFPYKKVAVFGATSGIGLALAERLIENNVFVIAIGRRKQNLASLVQKHGHDKVQASPFDVTQLDSIPNFVTNLTSTYPDLDLIFINSGIQRSIDFSKPDTVDLNVIQQEFTTNYLAPVALTKAFMPFLLKRSDEGKTSGILFTTSGLALVPMARCPNYCATKAAMHSFILTLREQLRDTKVNVLELYPPAVQTELHDPKHQPNMKGRSDIGMPLDEFTDEAWKGLTEGKDQIPVGTAKGAFQNFEMKKQEMFNGMAAHMRKEEAEWAQKQKQKQ